MISELLDDNRTQCIKFAEKCCNMESHATLWFELLKLYSSEKLDEVGNVFHRAKGALNPEEFEKLNQLWQKS